VRLLELPVALFLVVFFILHFGLFHLLHGVFLSFFFFAFAKIVHLDGRLVYLAVLFVYFYPWEAMRRVAGAQTPALVSIAVVVPIVRVVPPIPVLLLLILGPLAELPVVPVCLSLPPDIEGGLVAVPAVIVAVVRVVIRLVGGAARDQRRRGQYDDCEKRSKQAIVATHMALLRWWTPERCGGGDWERSGRRLKTGVARRDRPALSTRANRRYPSPRQRTTTHTPT
jgi:hypothetical protein